MDSPPPARRSLAATAGALALAAATALALNPGVPLAWAYDAVLPEAATLAAIRAGERIEAAGIALGLDAPRHWAGAAKAWLGAPD